MPEQETQETTAALFCKVITPAGIAYEGEVNTVEAVGISGVVEILPRHEPMMTPLAIDLMTITADGGETKFALHGGFLDMDGETVTILADAAEEATEIDIDRAQIALTRARERLAAVSGPADEVKIDMDRAQLALLRALNRLKATNAPERLE